MLVWTAAMAWPGCLFFPSGGREPADASSWDAVGHDAGEDGAPEASANLDARPPDAETRGFGTLVGWVSVGPAEDLVVAKGHAYVCAKDEGLVVVDVSRPTAPRIVDTLGDSYAWDVAATGDQLFVAGYEDGLHILSLADPAHPQPVGEHVPGWRIIQVAVDASTRRAYVSGGDGAAGRLEILDVSDPGAPRLLGAHDLPAGQTAGTALAVRADTLYYGQADGTLLVLDVADPANVRRVASFRNPGGSGHEPWALGLYLDGDLLYLSDWGAGLVILDVADPWNPRQLAVFDLGSYAYYDAWARGPRVYLALDGGLGVLDVADPSHPRLVGGGFLSCRVPGCLDDGPHGIWVQDGLAILADDKCRSLTVVSVEAAP